MTTQGAADCCRQESPKGHCPKHHKQDAGHRSCCTPERIMAAQNHSTLGTATVVLPLYTLSAPQSAPQIVAHRLVRTSISPAGPPGNLARSFGGRSPPLA